MKLLRSVVLILPAIAGAGFAQHGRAGGAGAPAGHASAGPAAHASAPAPAAHLGGGGSGYAPRPGGQFQRPVTSPGRPYGGQAPYHRSPRSVIVPYPLFIGGYYGAPLYGYGYDSYGSPYTQAPAPQQHP